jgi:HSP20 family molecular chaperone IbpA
MWNEALAMIEHVEHLHRRFLEPAFSSIERAFWEPPLDLFETERELCIVAALPGVALEDLHVSIDGDILRIAGQRRLPPAARAAAIRRLEIPHGKFERNVRLPAYRLTLARSELADGCLIVHLAKSD